jgi:hypothetical protein
MELIEGGAEVALVVILGITVDHSPKARLGATNGAIDQGKFSDVILVDHAKDRAFLYSVDGRVSQIILL